MLCDHIIFCDSVTDLKHPGSGLWPVFQETGSLLARGFLQPALIVHFGQALGAPDLSAGCLVVGPDAVQSHFRPPVQTHMCQISLSLFTVSLGSDVTYLLSPSPSGGLFLSSGYTMTSLRLKWTISSRFSPATFTSPGKKTEP